jgi:hypothetical protein
MHVLRSGVAATLLAIGMVGLKSNPAHSQSKESDSAA